MGVVVFRCKCKHIRYIQKIFYIFNINAGGAKWLGQPSKAVCLQALPFAGQAAQTSLCQMSKVGIIRFNIKNDSSTCSTPRCRAYLRIWPQGPGFICDQGDPVVCKYVAILLGFSNFHFFFYGLLSCNGLLVHSQVPRPTC